MKWLFYIFLYCITVKGLAQNPLYKRFFENSQSNIGAIYDVYQDKKGFIWLGTESGLMRFDGKSSVLFPARNAFGKAVTNLFEDTEGNIYCQNFSGQFFKTIKKLDSVRFVSEISKYGNIKQANVVNDSLVGFFDRESVSFYNLNNNHIARTPIKQYEIQPSTSKQKTNNYTVILPNLQQLIRYFPNQTDIKKHFGSKNVVFFHITFNNHDLILGKKPPFVVENIDSKLTIELKEIASNIIINGMTIMEHNIAILTSDGVYIYDENLKFKRHYFAKESVSSFLKDAQDNYWFGTLNNGLLLVSEPATVSLLNNKHFTAIAFKNNNLLAGTSDNEIYEISPANNYQTKLLYKDSTIHEIRDIYYNQEQDELLFSNQQLNIIKNYKLQKRITSVNDIKPVTNKTYLLSEGASVSLFPVSESDSIYKIWFNSNHKILNENRLALTKQNIRVKSSVMMNSNKIVSATSNGLLEFTKITQQELTFKNQKIKAISLAKINNDSLLIATPHNGVLLYTNNTIQEFINSPDLSFNDIYMLKVFEKKIFVVTYRGFEVFNFKKQKIAEQYLADGYHGCDLVDFVFKNNQTYIANVNGVIASPLYDYKKNNIAPKIYITKTSINGIVSDFSSTKELEYNSYYFDFLFSTIDYRGLETTKAYYKVNDGNWILTTENRILLTALEPNTYKIELKSVNERGFETINPTAISFIIKPPFYKTWWFIVMVFVSFVIIIFTFFKYRLHSIKKQNQILTEKIELESALQKSTLTSIKAQMNPHFIFNALNTIQSYIYLNDKKAAGDYLVSFSELTRYILEMSNREKIPLSDEIKALNLYLKLEKMRFEEEFHYEINTDNIASDTTMIPSMLIQPYLENAVKHGLLHKKGFKSVQVVFLQAKNTLTVEITDNGIGIEASTKINSIRNKKHNSFASEANKKRLEILNSNSKENIGIETISLKNEQQQIIGTKVIIKIPII